MKHLLKSGAVSAGDKLIWSRRVLKSAHEAVINQGNFARLISLKAEVDQRKMISFKLVERTIGKVKEISQ
jgi:hypothetical protein